MSYLINNQQKLNDIIFANRNKSYGAYSLRSEYGNTILKSLIIMSSFFGTLMSLAFYYSNRNNIPEQEKFNPLFNDTNIVTICNIKPEEPAEIKKIEKGKSIPKNTITKNTLVKISDSVNVEIHTVLNNNQNITSTNTNTTGIISSDPTTETISGTPTTNSTTTTGPFVFVDTPPEFEGGLKALYQFVSNNVRYPEIASENGKSGTVYVKFVVDEKGKVANLSLQNNIGYGLDEEALRVVGLIPNFKTPAKINGKGVKVYYQLPIKFKLN